MSLPLNVNMTVTESVQQFNMAVNENGIQLPMELSAVIEATPEYEGPYTVTPSLQQQTLETEGKKMTDDVTVEAMPRATLKDSALFPVQATFTVSSSGRVSVSGSKATAFQPVESEGYAKTTDSFSAVAVATGHTDLSTEAGKTVTPTESEQTAVASQKFTTGDIKVGAIPSDYVGSGVPQKSSADLTASGKTVTAPAGYYAEAASKDVSEGAYASPYNITLNPTLSVNYNTGVQYLHPLSTSGYMRNSTPVTGVFSGNASTQLYTLGATTYTPGATAQTIPAQRYLTGDQTISAVAPPFYDMSGPLAFLGVNAELVTTLTLADIKLSATSFASWTPSTTATDILASRTAGTFTATDTPNWNYYIVWETIIPEVFYTGSPVDKAKPLFLVALHVNEIFRRPSSYTNIQSSTLNNSVNMSAFTAANFLRYYGSTQGTITYTWATSYGFYAGITAATLSSASADSPTITAKSPKVTARCSTTYMSTGNAALIDQDKTIIKQKAYIYKAKIPTFMQGLWNRVISLVNEVDA